MGGFGVGIGAGGFFFFGVCGEGLLVGKGLDEKS
jgi:hypothetical protein